MSDKDTGRQGGIGFSGLLTILFIGLKLTGYIAWSWLWVLSPVWLPIAAILALAVICVAVEVVVESTPRKPKRGGA